MRFLLKAGMKFGRLTLLRRISADRWLCRCECGTEKGIHRCEVRRTKSCGCWPRERAGRLNLKHGKARKGALTPEFRIWRGIRERCLSPAFVRWDLYGGRGIKMADRWKDSFENFLADVGPRPSPWHQIDRIDNDGHYEPGNVRWATRTQNVRNRRVTVMVTFEGERVALADLAERHGMPVGLVRERVTRLGWTVERALAEPARRSA